MDNNIPDDHSEDQYDHDNHYSEIRLKNITDAGFLICKEFELFEQEIETNFPKKTASEVYLLESFTNLYRAIHKTKLLLLKG